MRRKKVLLLASGIIALFSVIIGWRRLPEAETPVLPPLIGVALPDFNGDNSRWRHDSEALRRELKTAGYRVILAVADGSQELQNQQIKALLEQNINLLIVTCINDQVDEILAQADRIDLPIIEYDRVRPRVLYSDYCVVFDNFRVGVVQGQALVAGLRLDQATVEKPRHLVLFAGALEGRDTALFFDGAMYVLQPHLDSGVLKIIGAAPRNSNDNNFSDICVQDWNTQNSERRLREILANENETIDAILSPNDAIARSLVNVLEQDPRYRENLPLITGQDAEFASMLLIKSGRQFMTVFKDIDELARAAAALAKAIITRNTGTLPIANLADDAKIAVPRAANDAQVVMLQPIAIFKENLNLPALQPLYTAQQNARLQEKYGDDF